VAVAVDGVGPAGSGAPRALTYLPVIGGEELQEEHLPAWGLDTDGVPVAGYDQPDDPQAAASLPRPQAIGVEELQALVEAIGDLPVIAHRAAREVEPLVRSAMAAGIPFHPCVVSVARLGHLLSGLKANHAASDLASALGVESAGPDDCRGRARLVARCYLRLVPLLEARGVRSIGGLIEFQDLPGPPLDFSGYAFSAEDVAALPAAPGVYRFLDRDRTVIYIGKARNLRVRVGSYFRPSARGTAKGRAILDQVHSMVTEVVDSELEANLLEAALLSEFRPRLNRQFEVHERPAPYGPRLNLVVVLRNARDPGCTLHLLRGGRYHARLQGVGAPEGTSVAGAVRAAIETAYFGNHADEPGTDLDWQLVASFLRRRRDEVNVLDVDECATAADAADRIAVLVAAALAGPGRVTAR
jgi:hypothetical protein